MSLLKKLFGKKKEKSKAAIEKRAPPKQGPLFLYPEVIKEEKLSPQGLVR